MLRLLARPRSRIRIPKARARRRRTLHALECVGKRDPKHDPIEVYDWDFVMTTSVGTVFRRGYRDDPAAPGLILLNIKTDGIDGCSPSAPADPIGIVVAVVVRIQSGPM